MSPTEWIMQAIETGGGMVIDQHTRNDNLLAQKWAENLDEQRTWKERQCQIL